MLRAKKEALQAIIDKLQELEAQYEATIQEKASLEAQVDDCTKRLDRAQRLIGGLGGDADSTSWFEVTSDSESWTGLGDLFKGSSAKTDAQSLQRLWPDVSSEVGASRSLIAIVGHQYMARNSTGERDCCDLFLFDNDRDALRARAAQAAAVAL